MTLTPEQIASGWRLHDGSDVCPIKDDRTVHDVMVLGEEIYSAETTAAEWQWSAILAYRIIEAHGADAEPDRPTPYPNGYDELVFDADGWSQTIIVDGKRPKWLRDDDLCSHADMTYRGWEARGFSGCELAIRVRRREPQRETVRARLSFSNLGPFNQHRDGTIDLIDGKPDLSTLKIAEDAL